MVRVYHQTPARLASQSPSHLWTWYAGVINADWRNVHRDPAVEKQAWSPFASRGPEVQRSPQTTHRRNDESALEPEALEDSARPESQTRLPLTTESLLESILTFDTGTICQLPPTSAIRSVHAQTDSKVFCDAEPRSRHPNQEPY
jgi:hypothetical protein